MSTAPNEPAGFLVNSVVPILRMYDVAASLRFYVDYLGCTLDWQSGEGDRPVYLQVSRGALVLHLSSHHDDGTPGTANGREMQLIDPASNRLRFFEPAAGD